MDPATQTPHSPTPGSTGAGPDLTGQTLGDFSILRRLGQGGMGQVYLAEQVSLKRKVALKVLREDVASNPTALARFKVESKTIAQLSHANIVQVHMIGEHEGRNYMVLEYVEGRNLRDYLARKGTLDVMLVLSIMRQVTGALLRASEMGIVHRDIKPENILLTRKGEVKVADFGLSRCLSGDQPLNLTQSGVTMGTPLYMSPEQVEGKPVDYRSDIYSFGVTCYHMLAGQPPFQGGNAFEVALKHVREEPAPLDTYRPDVPAALCAVVHRMMAKDPDQRYQSARDLLRDILRVRESLNGVTGCIPIDSIMTEPMPVATSGEVPSVRVPALAPPAPHRWRTALLALGVLVALAAGVGFGWYHRQARHDADTNPALPPPLPTGGAEVNSQKELEESLRKVVEQYLKDCPSGMDRVCVDLALLYLEQQRVPEAEALFKRMSERRTQTAYHLVGQVGLAITDALQSHAAASHAKFKELFEGRRFNRPVLGPYLANPKFTRWLSEALYYNNKTADISPNDLPQELRRFYKPKKS
jgi:serine/threonine-protein kinase